MNYFAEVPPGEASVTYGGGCFVFDDRVVVDVEGKAVEGVSVCFRCRWPLEREEVELVGGRGPNLLSACLQINKQKNTKTDSK